MELCYRFGYRRKGLALTFLSSGISRDSQCQIILTSAFYLFIGKGNIASSTLFVFDEPTTGLHFHDIRKLMDAFNALIKLGNTIIVIEHNLEIIKCADWIIDLGPDGGDKGGQIVFEGTPEDLVKCKASVTGQYLKEKLK